MRIQRPDTSVTAPVTTALATSHGASRTGPPAACPGSVTVCWAAKGGSGTTVVAAGLALTIAPPVLLVDLAGDLPAALGAAVPEGPGVHDWLRSGAGADGICHLAVEVAPGVEVVAAGAGRVEADHPRWGELATVLAGQPRTVVVDAGTGSPPTALLDERARSLLVTRACYLSLRRAVHHDHRPSGIVLVAEPGRALRAADVEAALGAPVVATLSIDPAVARAVDAGLLAARLPRVIRHDLRGAAA
jgi:hypothetical protein